jgi:hypothetical protein
VDTKKSPRLHNLLTRISRPSLSCAYVSAEMNTDIYYKPWFLMATGQRKWIFSPSLGYWCEEMIYIRCLLLGTLRSASSSWRLVHGVLCCALHRNLSWWTGLAGHSCVLLDWPLPISIRTFHFCSSSSWLVRILRMWCRGVSHVYLWTCMPNWRLRVRHWKFRVPSGEAVSFCGLASLIVAGSEYSWR